MALRKNRVILLMILAVIAAAIACLLISPQHWLRRESDVRVSVDGQSVGAAVYLGQPTDNEADAYLLVHAQGVVNFMLNFDDQSYRRISQWEFIRLGPGAWTFRSMQDGHFSPLLPFLHLNEFRFATASGHVVSVLY